MWCSRMFQSLFKWAGKMYCVKFHPSTLSIMFLKHSPTRTENLKKTSHNRWPPTLLQIRMLMMYSLLLFFIILIFREIYLLQSNTIRTDVVLLFTCWPIVFTLLLIEMIGFICFTINEKIITIMILLPSKSHVSCVIYGMLKPAVSLI